MTEAWASWYAVYSPPVKPEVRGQGPILVLQVDGLEAKGRVR